MITQDYGLASLVLPKGVRVFHHSGKEFDEANIGTLLEQRYHSGKLRKAGIRTKGPKPFTEKDHMSFRQALKRQLTKVYQVQKIVGNEGILFMLEYIKRNRKQDKCVPCSLLIVLITGCRTAFHIFILGVSEVASSKNKPNFHKIWETIYVKPFLFLEADSFCHNLFYFSSSYTFGSMHRLPKIMTNAAIAYVNIPNKETTSAFSTGAAWTSRRTYDQCS